MELKMKAICEGRKTRREVVEESLNQYRDVYLRVQQQLPKLHDVSSFSPLGPGIRLIFTGCSEICLPGRPRWREVGFVTLLAAVDIGDLVDFPNI